MSSKPRSTQSSGPRFPSKRDLWIEVLLLIAVAMMVGSIYAVVRDPTVGPWAGLFTIGLCVAGAGFSLWVLYGTSYGFRGRDLDIRCGPIRWRVALASIDRVRPSRNPLSAPAVSLDRLEVRYENSKRAVLISPADKAGFVRAVVARATHLEIRGEEAIRRESGS